MLKILFVEDDKDLNLLTTSHLKKNGYTVKSTFNGLDALSELENERFDMIISDIMMPLCDGFELARRLKIGTNHNLVIGNLTMNSDERTAYIDEEEISLTVREFNILYCMLSYPKKTFTRGKLMEDFWDYDSSATSRTVDVYMAKLREKTKNCTGFEIQTVHGLGYKVVIK